MDSNLSSGSVNTRIIKKPMCLIYAKNKKARKDVYSKDIHSYVNIGFIIRVGCVFLGATLTVMLC
jgi:hypothetical protein